METTINPVGEPFGSSDYKFLCQRVSSRFRVRLADYKPEQMSRRLASLARQCGCGSFVAYAGMLEKDASALEGFLDLMTINVTEFFRNASLFEDLSSQVLPNLSLAPGQSFSAWSAGCSNGSEAYTLAMILKEIYPDRQIVIKGTDIDLSIMARAGSPSYTEAEISGVSKSRRERFFNSPDGQTYMPKLQIRQSVSFFRHDLLADRYPTDEYDLILCRNVVIYFNEDAKERVYTGFLQALKPGGVLFVGGAERIASAAKIGFEPLQPFFYRKPRRPNAKERLAA